MAEVEEKTCFVCKMSDTDDINYGKWEQINQINVHYFCLVSFRKLQCALSLN